jgi:hypothetical protein
MSNVYITRRGGKVSEQALAPTITEVSVTDSSITFTIKNNDTETATIVYRIDDLTAEGESISLAGGATSSNITASGLDPDETYTVFATANVTGKVKSNVTEKEIESGPAPVYTAATGGTTLEYDDGGKRYKSHTFTSNGTFQVTTAGNGDRNQVDYLIIAGGGAGANRAAAGGGAGGYRTTIAPTPDNVSPNAKVVVSVASYGVTVGLGGAVPFNSGANSSVSFPTTITAIGGGRGGASGVTVAESPQNGGSGGGGSTGGGYPPGTGTAGQGFDGGGGSGSYPGGGGGAGQIGQNGTVGVRAGNGGNGLSNTLRTGSGETRGGGGGGGGLGNAGGNNTLGGFGGSGGGGNGGSGTANNAVAGAVNTGGGGGAGGTNVGVADYPGRAGGSGIVIIRYEIAPV